MLIKADINETSCKLKFFIKNKNKIWVVKILLSHWYSDKNHFLLLLDSENSGAKEKQIKLSDRDRGMSMETTKKIRDGNFEIFESVLILDSIRTEHYSMHFICKATNLFGTTAQTIQLVIIYLILHLKTDI